MRVFIIPGVYLWVMQSSSGDRSGAPTRNLLMPTSPLDSIASAHPYDQADGRRIRSTTVLCVRRNGSVVMAADGQVTLGSAVMKSSAKKLRRLYNDKVLAGFAGTAAVLLRAMDDAVTTIEAKRRFPAELG